MSELQEEYEILISGYLDGELTPEDEQRLEAMLASSAACRREFDAMKQLVTGTDAALRIDEPPEEVWDDFVDGVYNQLERKTGWVIFCLGVVALAIYGTVLFFSEPWASALTKFLIGVPVVGLAVLFVSVLRHRLHVIKTDRYTKEVHR